MIVAAVGMMLSLSDTLQFVMTMTHVVVESTIVVVVVHKSWWPWVWQRLLSWMVIQTIKWNRPAANDHSLIVVVNHYCHQILNDPTVVVLSPLWYPSLSLLYHYYYF